MGELLENHFSQLVVYAYALRIDNLFITDGLKWSHYTNLSPSNQEPTKIIDLEQLEEAELTKAAKFRMPNGHIVDVRSWTQILMEACKFCLTENQELLRQLPISDRTGRATNVNPRVASPPHT